MLRLRKNTVLPIVVICKSPTVIVAVHKQLELSIITLPDFVSNLIVNREYFKQKTVAVMILWHCSVDWF